MVLHVIWRAISSPSSLSEGEKKREEGLAWQTSMIQDYILPTMKPSNNGHIESGTSSLVERLSIYRRVLIELYIYSTF